MKAVKYESSEKNRENKVFKQHCFDKSYRLCMNDLPQTHTHTYTKELSWQCANL